MTPTISTANYLFNLHLKPNQLYDFRGAFIDMAVKSAILSDDQISILSNRDYQQGNWAHSLDRYPKIQYRIDNDRASLFALSDGISIMDKLIQHEVLDSYTLQDKALPIEVTASHKRDFTVMESGNEETYLLFHYLPFNTYDDHAYHHASTMLEKVLLLESVIGNSIMHSIKDFAEISITPKIAIVDIITKDKASYKTKDLNNMAFKEKLVSYFIKFRCNISGLDQLSIGKHKSLGYGVIRKVI